MLMKQSGLAAASSQHPTLQHTSADFLSEILKNSQPNLDYIKSENDAVHVVGSPAGLVASSVTSSPSPAPSPSMEVTEDDMTYMHNDPMVSLTSPAVDFASRRSSGSVTMEEAADMLG